MEGAEVHTQDCMMSWQIPHIMHHFAALATRNETEKQENGEVKRMPESAAKTLGRYEDLVIEHNATHDWAMGLSDEELEEMYKLELYILELMEKTLA